MDIKQITEAMRAELSPVVSRLDALEKERRQPATNNAGAVVDAAAAAAGNPKAVRGESRAVRVRRQRELMKETDPHKGRGLDFGACLRFHLLAQRGEGAPEMIARREGYDEVADILAEHKRTVSAGEVGSGGAIIPPALADEVLPLLVAEAVVLQLGPTHLPMPSGALSIVRETSAATAGYVGENAAQAPSTPGTDLLALTYKKLMAVVVISNDLLRFGGPKVDQWIRNRLIVDASLKFDLAAIRGTGAANELKGFKSDMASGQKITAANSTTPTLVQVEADLQSTIGKLQDANEKDDGTWAWIFHDRIRRYLMQLRDGAGPFVYRDELLAGKLLGYKVGRCNQIPKNLGGGTNETEIYLVKMSSVLYGAADDLEITFSPNGDYDDSGTVKSGFSLDQSPMRVIGKHDVRLARDVSAAMLQTVKWGA